jgi:hypothetical protein
MNTGANRVEFVVVWRQVWRVRPTRQAAADQVGRRRSTGLEDAEVQGFVQNAYSKLGVTSREELARVLRS